MRIPKSDFSTPVAFVANVLLAYAVYFLCRVVFALENGEVYVDLLEANSVTELIRGCLLFDTSAICYTNALYALVMLLPLHYKEGRAWQMVAKWVFVVVNSIAVAVNLADAVYFQYTGRRTTMSVFQEFDNENNLAGVFLAEMLRHWYLVLIAILLIAVLWCLYVMPSHARRHPCAFSYGRTRACRNTPVSPVRYYIFHVICFALYIPLCIGGMRGGLTHAVRPVTISNANQYVARPADAALILNTPFSLLRTLSRKTFVVPEYYSAEELDGIYSPVHLGAGRSAAPPDSLSPFVRTTEKRNVVILIVESFGREYIGAYNRDLDGGRYKGYTPFVDSLYQHCLSFDYTFCNGRKSIDGMPSILSSIPMFVEPFFLTPSSMNRVSGIANELGRVGYYSAFFHGAENGSMGFQAFARSTGFDDYFGRDEYNADSRFGGDADFDGTWAIWDEPFLQFYAQKMGEMREPFVTAVFTASSHHPFVVPEEYSNIYRDEDGNVIHKCIRYTDNALRRFFETASRQPWFEHTLFVLTSDHTNLSDHPEYKTSLGEFAAPILFYDPSATLIRPGRMYAIAQQIDIMPTLLDLLAYPHSYVAFGKSLISSPANWAVNYNNGIYQYVQDNFLLQFDGERSRALYDICADPLLQHNLMLTKTKQASTLERSLKAVIQSYMQRMTSDSLTVR